MPRGRGPARRALRAAGAGALLGGLAARAGGARAAGGGLGLGALLGGASGGGGGLGGTSGGDARFVACGVCAQLAGELSGGMARLQAALPACEPHVSEAAALGLMEGVCEADAAGGAWLGRLDLVPEGEKLRVADRGVRGRCRTVCRTAQRACRNVMDAQDTDLSELLWGLWRRDPGAGAEGHVRTLFDSLCSGACAAPPPPLPAQWVLPETFEALTEEELELEGFKREMQGDGLDMDGMDLQLLGKEELGKQLGGDAPETGSGGGPSDAEGWEAFSNLLGELGMGGAQDGGEVEVVEL